MKLLSIAILGSIFFSETALSSEREAMIPIPQRVSRSLFEFPLVGTVQVNEGNPYQSSTVWVEYPPTDPIPKEGYLADFRDRTGCLELNQVQGVSVCFRVMPDVSSVSLSHEELSVTGLEGLVAREYPHCIMTGSFNTLQFKGATRNGDSGFSVRYQATTEGCVLDFTAEFSVA